MGLLGLISRSLCNISGFVYPCYASYKALTAHDAAQLERWLVYWCVVGSWTAVEGATAGLLAWLPFYSEVKLLAVLWMVAPQTEGSTLLYAHYLEPLFTSHERDVDAYLGDLRYTVGGWLQKAFAAAWTLARERLNLAAFMPETPPVSNRSPQESRFDGASSGDGTAVPVPASLYSASPTVYNDTSGGSPAGQPHSQAYNYAASLVQQYAPMVIAAGKARFGDGVPAQAQQRDARNLSVPRSTQTFEADQPRLRPSATSTPSTSSTSSGFSSRPLPTTDIRSRRAQLEAELAALASPPSHLPTDGRASSSGSVPPSPPDRIDSPMTRSGYDEIGRDEIDDGSLGGGGDSKRRTSGGWFGWGGSPASKGGYQKISKRD